MGSTSCPAEGPLPPRLRLWHQWAESDALSSEAANGKSASSEAASDKSASSEAASDKSASSEAVSDKSASSENGSDHSTPQPSGDDPSSDELDDRVGDDFPYKELPKKSRRTSHASEPHSHSHARGHRATDADTKRGIAVARKVAAPTLHIPPITPAGTVATIIHPAPPVG